MWILSGVFERFPELKVVFVEPGLGWVAWWLSSSTTWCCARATSSPCSSELPSYYFHRNMALTFIDEPDRRPALLRHRLGVENIMWSSDYPHPVSTLAEVAAPSIDEQFDGIPDDERELMVWRQRRAHLEPLTRVEPGNPVDIPSKGWDDDQARSETKEVER